MLCNALLWKKNEMKKKKESILLNLSFLLIACVIVVKESSYECVLSNFKFVFVRKYIKKSV